MPDQPIGATYRPVLFAITIACVYLSAEQSLIQTTPDWSANSVAIW
jgi:hypothetical protein